MQLSTEALLKLHTPCLGHADCGVPMIKVTVGEVKTMVAEEEPINCEFQLFWIHRREETEVASSPYLATKHNCSYCTAAVKCLHQRWSPTYPG